MNKDWKYIHKNREETKIEIHKEEEKQEKSNDNKEIAWHYLLVELKGCNNIIVFFYELDER